MKILIKTSLRKKRVRHTSIISDSRRILSLLKLSGVELSIYIVGDRKMRSINRKYRNLDRTTDVISFPQMDRNDLKKISGKTVVIGDIVMNINRIMRQAKEHKVPLRRELRFVLIHSILHLLGYDHEGNFIDMMRMRKKEKSILNALEKMDR